MRAALARTWVLVLLAWRQLMHRRAVWAFLLAAAILGLAPTWAVASLKDNVGQLADLSRLLELCLSLGWETGRCGLVWMAAGALQQDVAQRTLGSIWVRPVVAWEFLAGQALAHIGLFCAFVALSLAAAAALALKHGESFSPDLVWQGLVQVAQASMWVQMAVSASALTSAALTRLGLMAGIFLTWRPGLLAAGATGWRRTLEKILAALSPPTLPESASAMGALALLQTFVLGAAVLVACAWFFGRRDVPLRPPPR